MNQKGNRAQKMSAFAFNRVTASTEILSHHIRYQQQYRFQKQRQNQTFAICRKLAG